MVPGLFLQPNAADAIRASEAVPEPIVAQAAKPA
jgi:hypothetical protein